MVKQIQGIDADHVSWDLVQPKRQATSSRIVSELPWSCSAMQYSACILLHIYSCVSSLHKHHANRNPGLQDLGVGDGHTTVRPVLSTSPGSKHPCTILKHVLYTTVRHLQGVTSQEDPHLKELHICVETGRAW